MGYTRKGGMYTPTQSQFRQINIRSSNPEKRQDAIESIRNLRNKIVCDSEKALIESLDEYKTKIESYFNNTQNGAAVNYIVDYDLLLTAQFKKKILDNLSKTKKGWWKTTEQKKDKINNEYKKKFCSNFEIAPLVDVLVYNHTTERHPTTYIKIKELYDYINTDNLTSGDITAINSIIYNEKINKNESNSESHITRNSEPTSNSSRNSILSQRPTEVFNHSKLPWDSILSQRPTEVFNHSKLPWDSTLSQRPTEVFNHSKLPWDSTLSQRESNISTRPSSSNSGERDSNISTISSLTNSSGDAPQTEYITTPYARDFFKEVPLYGGKRTRRKYKKKYKKKV